MNELTSTATWPVRNSRRHKSQFEDDKPPPGIEWKPVIRRYREDGTIEFEDESTLGADEVDKVIYCTGYRPSFPFWNVEKNGRPLYDYENGKLINTYWHTFFSDLKTIAIVGIQKALTFRSFEYQAVALARLFAGRNVLPLPPVWKMRRWEEDRLVWVKETGRKYHDIESQPGRLGNDTMVWLGFLYRMAGLGTLKGDGRLPPVLSTEVLDALKNIHKYPRPNEDFDSGEVAFKDSDRVEGDSDDNNGFEKGSGEKDWVLVVGHSPLGE